MSILQHKPELPSWRLVAATAVAALVASLSLVLSSPATMDVDGQRIVSDVAPVTAGGVAYLPVRAVSEAAGAVASYDAQANRITVRRGTDALVLTVGNRVARFDGQPVQLGHAPFIVRGRVMVRAADVAMALDSSVQFDARRDRIDVRTPGAVVAGAPEDSP